MTVCASAHADMSLGYLHMLQALFVIVFELKKKRFNFH